MSHVADCDIKIRPNDLAPIKAAVKQLGGTFHEGQRTYRWFGRFLDDWSSKDAAVRRVGADKIDGKCEHAITFPGCNYDVGLVMMDDGTLKPLFDTYGEGHKLVKLLGGNNAPKLKNEYAAAASMRVLARKGFRVQRTEVGGKIVLKATT